MLSPHLLLSCLLAGAALGARAAGPAFGQWAAAFAADWGNVYGLRAATAQADLASPP